MLHKKRLYVVPHLHPFTSSISTGSFLQQQSAQQTVTLHCRFSSKARLAYLLDHVVMGRPLLPAAAMIELAAAAAASLTQDSAHDSGDLLSVSNMSISAPIILPSADAEDSDGFEVICSVDLTTGQLSIGYSYSKAELSGAGFKPVTCATATACLVRPTQQAQQGTGLQAAAATLLADSIKQSIAAATAESAAVTTNPIGTITSVSEDWAASGYFSAPQQVDSALHLGVVAPGSGAKVPVALGSFLVPAAAVRGAGTGISPTGAMLASTCSSSSSSIGMTASGLSTSSFLLSSTEGPAAATSRTPGPAAAVGATAGGLVVVVEDLQTKVVKRADLSKARMQQQAAGTPACADSKQAEQTAAGASAAAAADESYPCSYETEWQVKEARPAATAGPQFDSRHAGKLSLLVHDTPAAAGRSVSEQLVLQLRPNTSNSAVTPAAAAASTLAVLQQVNQVQQAHAAAGTGRQMAINAGVSLAGSTLGVATGLQGLTGTGSAADAASAVWGLLRTEATEQTAVAVSLQAVDSAPSQHSRALSAVGGCAGAPAASAVQGGVLEVPRMLSCSRPEGAELIIIRPEPRSALSNLVARAADISQVRLCQTLVNCFESKTPALTHGYSLVIVGRFS
jgi:hypothetical protein